MQWTQTHLLASQQSTAPSKTYELILIVMLSHCSSGSHLHFCLLPVILPWNWASRASNHPSPCFISCPSAIHISPFLPVHSITADNVDLGRNVTWVSLLFLPVIGVTSRIPHTAGFLSFFRENTSGTLKKIVFFVLSLNYVCSSDVCHVGTLVMSAPTIHTLTQQHQSVTYECAHTHKRMRKHSMHTHE